MKLRLVAGTDVAAPAASTPPAGPLGELLYLLEPLHELFERYKEAQGNYRRAIADVAQRTAAASPALVTRSRPRSSGASAGPTR
jgi:hypothetical protein